MKKQLVVVVLALFLTSLACSLVSSGSSDTGSGNTGSGNTGSGNTGSGNTGGGGNVVASTPTPDNVLFKDDFSDSGSGWHTATTDNVTREYTSDGQFRLIIKTLGSDGKGYEGWTVPDLNFSGDIRYEVDATKAGGSDNNYFGILCRYTNNSSDSEPNNFQYYYFEISSDGFVIIGKYDNGTDEFLSADKMQSSDAIKQGAATNHLRADCIGDKLTFYVNGQQVAEVTDSSFSSGDIGFLAGTVDEPNTEILFDNVLVTKP